MNKRLRNARFMHFISVRQNYNQTRIFPFRKTILKAKQLIPLSEFKEDIFLLEKKFQISEREISFLEFFLAFRWFAGIVTQDLACSSSCCQTIHFLGTDFACENEPKVLFQHLVSSDCVFVLGNSETNIISSFISKLHRTLQRVLWLLNFLIQNMNQHN